MAVALLPRLRDHGGRRSWRCPQREWIEVLRGPRETDATFLIRRFGAWRVADDVRASAYEELDVPLCVAPRQRHAVTYTIEIPAATYRLFNVPPPPPPGQGQGRSSFHAEVRRSPVSVRSVSAREGQRLIDLARVQMITRERDLYAFCHADHNDVRLVGYADGLQFVCYGLQPRRRLLLESLYVFLILKNGVPVGYTQASSLFRSAEVNFNVFHPFRGTETTTTFALTLAMVRHLFGADTIVINPQQLGQGNPEALHTGAFWFYHKHGFRPRDPATHELIAGRTGHG